MSIDVLGNGTRVRSVIPDVRAATAPEPAGFATCPSCHTADAAVTSAAVSGGADWRCVRCGQRWDANRLATVAAYDAWLSRRADSSRERATDARGDA
jgi:hypothetical protein